MMLTIGKLADAAGVHVNGVSGVETSLEDKSAGVTFDDEHTDIASLEKTSAEAGSPSSAEQGTKDD